MNLLLFDKISYTQIYQLKRLCLALYVGQGDSDDTGQLEIYCLTFVNILHTVT